MEKRDVIRIREIARPINDGRGGFFSIDSYSRPSKFLHSIMRAGCLCLFMFAIAHATRAQDTPAGITGTAGSPQGKDVIEAKVSAATSGTNTKPENWNWHFQNTDIVQYHPNFPALYSGPNSMQSTDDVRESVTVDLTIGMRLWNGAEFFADGLMYQGFGFNNSIGAGGLPNGDMGRGSNPPAFTLARLFLRQTIGFGGEQEDVQDDSTHLAGKRDVSRLTLTIGKFSAEDIFDNNAYANDPRTQFMNWSLMANGAWDYAQDALGYITGMTAELNQPQWALRYGWLQEMRDQGGLTADPHYLKAWQMVTEGEYRYSLGGHPGVARLLAYLSRAHMGNYSDALESSNPTNIVNQYDYKYGFGLNMEQEVAKDVGVFMRLGWNDGHTQSWTFTDVDRTASLGVSVKGSYWGRPGDTYGLAGVVNGISGPHRNFLAAGGLGLNIGDGTLTYGPESILETYYDANVWRSIHMAVDFQFINNPAYNKDRGPIPVFAARLHWEF